MRLVRPVYAVAGVLALLALLLLPDLNRWMVQRSEIVDVHRQVARAQREADALAAERLRWQDPQYVMAQAREHLFFVMPGETGLVVAGGSGTASGPGTAEVPAAGDPARPWFGDLWESVRVAGVE